VRLKDYLTDDLNKTFDDNEAYLKQLLTQEVIDSKDLEKLQHLWENLTHEINKIKNSTSEKMNALKAEEMVTQLYSE